MDLGLKFPLPAELERAKLKRLWISSPFRCQEPFLKEHIFNFSPTILSVCVRTCVFYSSAAPVVVSRQCDYKHLFCYYAPMIYVYMEGRKAAGSLGAWAAVVSFMWCCIASELVIVTV